MDYIFDFVADCQARGLTAHTIETYRSCLNAFLRTHTEPTEINLDDLRTFLGELRARGLQGSTLKGYFYALSSFYNFLVYEGLVVTNPVLGFRKRHMSRIKLQRNTRQLISVQEMKYLVSAAAGVKEKALIMTLAKTGMRRGELLGLKVKDIDIDRGYIRVPPKAKRSQLIAFMDAELQGVLAQYLHWRAKYAKSDWLWISKRGGRIHKDTTGKIIARLGEQLGLHKPGGALEEKLTPHCFRHWFTTYLFREGMNRDYIKWLRGDSLRSEAWEWYNHIDPETVKQEYLRCIPRLLREIQTRLSESRYL
jgi:integrase/recombinase XerD